MLKSTELIVTGSCRCHCGLKYFQHRPLKACDVKTRVNINFKVKNRKSKMGK